MDGRGRDAGAGGRTLMRLFHIHVKHTSALAIGWQEPGGSNVSAPRWDAWIAQQAAPAASTGSRGAQLFQHNTCVACHTIRGLSGALLLGQAFRLHWSGDRHADVDQALAASGGTRFSAPRGWRFAGRDCVSPLDGQPPLLAITFQAFVTSQSSARQWNPPKGVLTVLSKF
jgi:mono/diheme cytochrome c family protein